MGKVIKLKRVNKRDITLRVLTVNESTGEVNWIRLGKFPTLKAAEYKATSYGRNAEYVIWDGWRRIHHKPKHPPSARITDQAGIPTLGKGRP